MGIKREDIEYIAKLARIELDEELLSILYRDLGKILDYVDQLKTLDIEGIPPTTHALELFNIFRDDVVGESLDKEDILKYAPSRKKGFFKVPKVIE